MLLVIIAVKGDGGANFQINVSLTYLSQLRVMGWGGGNSNWDNVSNLNFFFDDFPKPSQPSHSHILLKLRSF